MVTPPNQMSAFLAPVHLTSSSLRLGLLRSRHTTPLTSRRSRYLTPAFRASAAYPQASKKNGFPNNDSAQASASKSPNALKEILYGVYQLAIPLWTGRRRGAAWLWTAATVLLAFGATMYAVLLSTVKKFFWNVISQKDVANFPKLLAVYGLTVMVGPILLGMFDWVKERLALVWRRALTETLLDEYFDRLNYYKLSQGMGDIDNPDQRIAEDVSKFTTRAVRFFTVMGVAIFDFFIFSVILYRIFKPLWFVLLGYAFLGTLATALVGGRLLELNRMQAMKEADFRFGLVRVREATENVAFYAGENSERTELTRRFGLAFRNNISLTGLKRNVSFVSRSFQYWAQVLPTAVIAPQYFAGKILMGTISQVFFSFNHVLTSVGLVVAEFSALLEFGAGVRRLKGLSDAMAVGGPTTAEGGTRIETTIDAAQGASTLRVEELTVETPTQPRRTLVKELNLEVGKGDSLLVIGISGLGKSSLMRAICGLWDSGTGHVTRPPSKNTLFLPQKPFIMLGCLRENVIYPSTRKDVTDAEVEDALRRVNLEYMLHRDEGLSSSGETLTRRLSLGEQQRLAFARIVISKPTLVVLDESSSALDLANERDMYQLVKDMGATVISVGNRPSLLEMHNHVLLLKDGGQWEMDRGEKAEVFVKEK